MIITDLYQTQIDTANYEVAFGTSNIAVSVKLVDFNGYGVVGKEIHLSVDKGYFTECVGASTQTFSNTTTKTVSARTDNSGKIVVKYTASEAGLATFSANNMKMSISVTKWKSVKDTENIKIRTNGQLVSCFLTGENWVSNTTWTLIFNLGSELASYAPQHTIFTRSSFNVDVRLSPDGAFHAISRGDAKQVTAQFYALYLKQGV